MICGGGVGLGLGLGFTGREVDGVDEDCGGGDGSG